MRRSPILGAVSALYGVAILVGIFVGGFVPILIVGAVLVGAAYAVLGGGRRPGGVAGGRNRNRNRNRG